MYNFQPFFMIGGIAWCVYLLHTRALFCRDEPAEFIIDVGVLLLLAAVIADGLWLLSSGYKVEEITGMSQTSIILFCLSASFMASVGFIFLHRRARVLDKQDAARGKKK